MRPNVLMFVSHDTGRFIGPYGVATVQTPNAMRFASQGAVMERCFCTAPQCSPSRASIFTGRYPHCTGVMGLTHGQFLWDMNRDEVHAAAHFKTMGYDTMLVGHPHEVRTREGRGWDRINIEVDGLKSAAALDGLLGARGDTSRPFFAQVCTHQTHRPFPTPAVQPDASLGVTVPPYLDDTPATREDFAALQGSVKQWDQALGLVLDLLDRQGLADNTIVVVTTDHGLAMPRAKCTLYDPGIEVLLMVRWNGRIEPGRRHGQLLSNIDILPTLLEAAGAQPNRRMQGRSFWPLLTGGPYEPNEMIFAEHTFHTYYNPMRAVRTERFKYIHNFEIGCTMVPLDAVEGGAYRDNLARIYRPQHHQFEEFYDLQADPWEQQPLAAQQHADVRAHLTKALADWMSRTNDPLLAGPVASPYFSQALGQVRALAVGGGE